MLERKLKQAIATVDWDFPLAHFGISRPIHWYPGTFPGELPGTLIEAFSKVGDVVLDPFCGVGTTGLEALRQSRRALLTESNLIGCLATYVGCALQILATVNPGVIEPLMRICRTNFEVSKENQCRLFDLDDLSSVSTIDELLAAHMRPTPCEAADLIFSGGGAKWKLIANWLEGSTLRNVRRVVDRVLDESDGQFLRLLCMVGISANLRATSSQTQSWGHIADNVRPKTFVVKNFSLQLGAWLTRLETNLREIARQPRSTRQRDRCLIIRHDWTRADALKIDTRFRADLLVTSPPYGNAIDYTYAQRLSLYLFGYDDDGIAEMSSTEIGARRKRFSSKSEAVWTQQLTTGLANHLRLMKERATVCLILPHKDHGREAAADAMNLMMLELGWTPEVKIDRSIRQSRTRQSWTSITRETIRVYCRG